jgi:hypothetical protein
MVEKLRIREIRRIELLIKDVDTRKRRSEETIQRIRASTVGDPTFIAKTLEKNREIVENSSYEIDDLKMKIISVQRGECDEELLSTIKSTTEKIKSIQTEKETEKRNKYKQDEIKKKKSWEKTKEGYDDDRKIRDYKKSYDYFVRISNSLPDYLLSNLKNMPCNKGYIFKGVWFMGYLPEEYGQSTVLFEKQGQTNLIHEYKKDVYLLWERDGRHKKLLSKTFRRVI